MNDGNTEQLNGHIKNWTNMLNAIGLDNVQDYFDNLPPARFPIPTLSELARNAYLKHEINDRLMSYFRNGIKANWQHIKSLFNEITAQFNNIQFMLNAY